VDPLSRRRFWDLIYALTDAGVTVFVSTHYMEEAEYCHRLALMNRGRLIALDTPVRLRAGMDKPILEVRTDNGPKTVEILQGKPDILEAAMFGRAVHVVVRDVAEARTSIPALLESRGVAVQSVEEVAPSLEDAFVSLIRDEGGAVIG
jgi:ABC-2 type transport system ATP-binding protein